MELNSNPYSFFSNKLKKDWALLEIPKDIMEIFENIVYPPNTDHNHYFQIYLIPNLRNNFPRFYSGSMIRITPRLIDFFGGFRLNNAVSFEFKKKKIKDQVHKTKLDEYSIEINFCHENREMAVDGMLFDLFGLKPNYDIESLKKKTDFPSFQYIDLSLKDFETLNMELNCNKDNKYLKCNSISKEDLNTNNLIENSPLIIRDIIKNYKSLIEMYLENYILLNFDSNISKLSLEEKLRKKDSKITVFSFNKLSSTDFMDIELFLGLKELLLEIFPHLDLNCIKISLDRFLTVVKQIKSNEKQDIIIDLLIQFLKRTSSINFTDHLEWNHDFLTNLLVENKRKNKDFMLKYISNLYQNNQVVLIINERSYKISEFLDYFQLSYHYNMFFGTPLEGQTETSIQNHLILDIEEFRKIINVKELNSQFFLCYAKTEIDSKEKKVHLYILYSNKENSIYYFSEFLNMSTTIHFHTLSHSILTNFYLKVKEVEISYNNIYDEKERNLIEENKKRKISNYQEIISKIETGELDSSNFLKEKLNQKIDIILTHDKTIFANFCEILLFLIKKSHFFSDSSKAFNKSALEWYEKHKDSKKLDMEKRWFQVKMWAIFREKFGSGNVVKEPEYTNGNVDFLIKNIPIELKIITPKSKVSNSTSGLDFLDMKAQQAYLYSIHNRCGIQLLYDFRQYEETKNVYAISENLDITSQKTKIIGRVVISGNCSKPSSLKN